MAPLLAPLLDDPIAALRIVTARSLRTLPGYATFEYDFDADAAARTAAVARARETFKPSRTKAEGAAAVLFEKGGTVDKAGVQALLDARDETPSAIGE